MAKERASEEYKENDRSTSIHEDHLGHKKSTKMKNSMTRLPKKERGLRHTLVVTLLSHIIDAEPSNYEEVAKKKGKETMIKEYQLIKRNDV